MFDQLKPYQVKEMIMEEHQKLIEATNLKKPQMKYRNDFNVFMRETKKFVKENSKRKFSLTQRPHNSMIDKYQMQNDINSKFDRMINGKQTIIGNTWDCSHLNSFLNKSEFGHQICQNLNRTHSMSQQQHDVLKGYGKVLEQEPSGIIQLEKLHKSNQLNSNISESLQEADQNQNLSSTFINSQGQKISLHDINNNNFADMSTFHRSTALGTGHKHDKTHWKNTQNASICFLGPSKFKDGSIYNDLNINFKSCYDDKNYLVYRENNQKQKQNEDSSNIINQKHNNNNISDVSQEFIEANKFQPKTRDFIADKLDFGKQPVRFNSVDAYKAEFDCTKEHQVRFQQWKQDYMLRNKKKRIFMNQYRSGIMSVDNPYNENSIFFQEEARRIQDLKTKRAAKMEQIKNGIFQKLKTNSDISFFNQKNQSQQNQKHVNQIDNKYYDSTWQSKNRATSEYIRKALIDSHSKVPPADGEEGGLKRLHKRNFSLAYAPENKNTQDRLFGFEKADYSLTRAKHLYDSENKGKLFDVISQVNKKLILPKVHNDNINSNQLDKQDNQLLL